jgi:FKBP12-rapamycin complex-associated protein
MSPPSSIIANWTLQVATIVAEMPPDVVVKLWEDEITPRLADLIHSQNSWENFGGVSAIGT